MLDIENLWIHAIGCGLAALEVSKKIEESVSNQIFLAGLLHDTGKLILALYFSEEYRAVLEEANNSQIFLSLKETEVLGLNHAEISGLIMERWNFPDKIRVPAHFHHTSIECPPDFRSQAMVIELADYICRKSDVGNSGNPVIADVEAISSELGISEDDVESTICKINEMRPQIEEFFKLIK
jgi:HD-like signal output (HDOD) protein